MWTAMHGIVTSLRISKPDFVWPPVEDQIEAILWPWREATVAADRTMLSRLSAGWSGDGDGVSPGLGADLLEEVVALVVDDDEGREVDDVDLPHRLHAELGVLEHLDLA